MQLTLRTDTRYRESYQLLNIMQSVARTAPYTYSIVSNTACARASPLLRRPVTTLYLEGTIIKRTLRPIAVDKTTLVVYVLFVL